MHVYIGEFGTYTHNYKYEKKFSKTLYSTLSIYMYDLQIKSIVKYILTCDVVLSKVSRLSDWQVLH